jgi:hypothetical protein
VTPSAATIVLSSTSAGGNRPSHAVGITAFAVLIVAVVAVAAATTSSRWRPKVLRGLGLLVTGSVAIYVIGRGIAEFWVVDYSNPASYNHSWGGPSLAGVFVVHSGPAALIVVAGVVWLSRRRAGRQGEPAVASSLSSRLGRCRPAGYWRPASHH